MDTPEPRRSQSRHSDIIERSLQRLDDALQSPSGTLHGRPRPLDRRSGECLSGLGQTARGRPPPRQPQCCEVSPASHSAV